MTLLVWLINDEFCLRRVTTYLLQTATRALSPSSRFRCFLDAAC